MVLSRFFGKSKPIVYVCLTVGLSVLFFLYVAKQSSLLNIATWGNYIIFLLLFFGINFIVKRNKINYKNTYAVFVFTMLCMAMPGFFTNYTLLLPSFFVVLGLRRVLSLKTQIDTKKKIFDASLWFFVASLFQPYLMLLMLLVFIGVLQYTLYEPKNMFIPILAWACGGLFFTAFQLWQTDQWMFFYEYYTPFGWSDINEIWQDNMLFFILLIPFVLFVVWKNSQIISKAQLSLKTSLSLVVLAYLSVLFGWFFSNETNIAGIGISFIPLSMLAGSSLEHNLKPIVREVILWIILCICLYLSLEQVFS